MQRVDEYYAALEKALRLKQLGAFSEGDFEHEKVRLREFFLGSVHLPDQSHNASSTTATSSEALNKRSASHIDTHQNDLSISNNWRSQAENTISRALLQMVHGCYSAKYLYF